MTRNQEVAIARLQEQTAEFIQQLTEICTAALAPAPLPEQRRQQLDAMLIAAMQEEKAAGAATKELTMNNAITTKILLQLNELNRTSKLVKMNLDRWPDQEVQDTFGMAEYLQTLNITYTSLLQAERYVAEGEKILKSMPSIDESNDEELDAALRSIYTIFFVEFIDARRDAGSHRIAMPAAREEIGEYIYEAKLTEDGWLASVQGPFRPFSMKNWDKGGAVFGVHPTPAAAIAAAKNSGWKSPNEA